MFGEIDRSVLTRNLNRALGLFISDGIWYNERHGAYHKLKVRTDLVRRTENV